MLLLYLGQRNDWSERRRAAQALSFSHSQRKTSCFLCAGGTVERALDAYSSTVEEGAGKELPRAPQIGGRILSRKTGGYEREAEGDTFDRVRQAGGRSFVSIVCSVLAIVSIEHSGRIDRPEGRKDDFERGEEGGGGKTKALVF
ncbi:unnamed protein product [Calypogeia fissa]